MDKKLELPAFQFVRACERRHLGTVRCQIGCSDVQANEDGGDRILLSYVKKILHSRRY